MWARPIILNADSFELRMAITFKQLYTEDAHNSSYAHSDTDIITDTSVPILYYIGAALNFCPYKSDDDSLAIKKCKANQKRHCM